MSTLSQFFGSGVDPRYPLDGPFGTGKIVYFYQSGTFTVPTGITSVRARVWGAGQSSGNSAWGDAGGTSSFGAYCSATGGGGGAGGAGGVGSGGDINRTGGITIGQQRSGGGGVANLFTNGGSFASSGAFASGAGGNGELNNNYSINGQSGYAGPGGLGATPTATTTSVVHTPATHGGGFVLGVASIDLIGCGGGGGGAASSLGNGAGGCGTNGGGGGGGNGSDQKSAGNGGFPGGGAGGAISWWGGAGGGFAIKTITGLTPGGSIAVTVGQPAGASNGGRGLVIVEY